MNGNFKIIFTFFYFVLLEAIMGCCCSWKPRGGEETWQSWRRCKLEKSKYLCEDNLMYCSYGSSVPSWTNDSGSYPRRSILSPWQLFHPQLLLFWKIIKSWFGCECWSSSFNFFGPNWFQIDIFQCCLSCYCWANLTSSYIQFTCWLEVVACVWTSSDDCLIIL